MLATSMVKMSGSEAKSEHEHNKYSLSFVSKYDIFVSTYDISP